jgi:hypothetical protein
VTVSSNASGGAGAFIFNPSYVYGLYLVATYTDFLRIGDADTDGFYVYYHDETTKVRWDVSDCTFTSCGVVRIRGESALDAVCRHERNVHTASLGATSIFVNMNAANSGGTRTISGNVFDKGIGDGTGQMRDFTVSANYVGGEVRALQGSLWVACDSNFICKESANTRTITRGLFADNVFFSALALSNPHWVSPDLSNSVVISGNVFDMGGTDSSGDGGDIILSSNGSVAITVTVENNLVLPGCDGRPAGCLVTMFGSVPNTSFAINHNTVYLDRQGIVDFETGTLVAGKLLSLKSNIAWGLSANASAIFKIRDFTTTETIDVADPVNVDYNVGWNYNTTNKGYQGEWSSGPAATHDIDANPTFTDATRNTATWDSAYLGNAPATWDSHGSGDTFAVGDFVANADAGVYSGTTVNYRCILSHTKSTANSEPGVGSAWRTYWEYASLYRIRQAVAAGTEYQPDALNGLDAAAGVTVALRSWIRTGFAPTNTLLQGAAHDATDIGAVPVASATTYTLVVDVVAVTLSASDVGISRSLSLPVGASSVATTATDVALAVGRTLSVDAAMVTVTAPGITLTQTGSYALIVDSASVALTPADVAFARALSLSVTTEQLQIATQDVMLASSRTFAVGAVAVAITPQEVALTLTQSGAYTIAVESVAVAISTEDTGLAVSRALPLSGSAVSITPADAGLWRVYELPVDGATVDVNVSTVDTCASRVLVAVGTAIAITPSNITLALNAVIVSVPEKRTGYARARDFTRTI